MVLTRLEEIEKSKKKVYIDNEYVFQLYQKDLEYYGLKEGSVITQADYERILEDRVYRRAKQKALAILKFMDRTEQELRTKLADAGYLEDAVEQAMAYLYEYNYINDERYASSYIRARMYTKSKMLIKNELIYKGISKEIVDRIIKLEYENDDMEEDAELTAIRKAVAKKTSTPDSLTPKDKQKLMAALYRKGFDVEKIRHVLSF